MDFSQVKSWTIPAGNVTKVTNSAGVVLWSAVKEPEWHTLFEGTKTISRNSGNQSWNIGASKDSTKFRIYAAFNMYSSRQGDFWRLQAYGWNSSTGNYDTNIIYKSSSSTNYGSAQVDYPITMEIDTSLASVDAWNVFYGNAYAGRTGTSYSSTLTIKFNTETGNFDISSSGGSSSCYVVASIYKVEQLY